MKSSTNLGLRVYIKQLLNEYRDGIKTSGDMSLCIIKTEVLCRPLYLLVTEALYVFIVQLICYSSLM